ncbi:MAG: hypothetical protein SXA11_10310, partial [Cyanobacteriota bacterium]|nr:hypothetical protein [Cyanobacteriota bacterium]
FVVIALAIHLYKSEFVVIALAIHLYKSEFVVIALAIHLYKSLKRLLRTIDAKTGVKNVNC